jgi:cytochrome c biogenesis protein CcdA
MLQGLLENIQGIVQNQHGLAYIAVFIGGLISAASPCVLAAIPLIIGYVGGYSEGNKNKAALSLSGIRSWTLDHLHPSWSSSSGHGTFIGFMGRWLILLAVIAILMGLQLMGSFIPALQKTAVRKGLIGFPAWHVNRHGHPCATPVLAVILAYVSTQEILYTADRFYLFMPWTLRAYICCGLSVDSLRA